MLRNLVIALACLSCGLASAETVVPLTIGGTEIRFAIDDGYLRTSEKLPTSHALAAAALPPGNRLVEGFVTEQDAKRQVVGLPGQDVFIQVQVLRNAEGLDFSEADWQKVRPAIAKSMTTLDVGKIANAQQASANSRMSDTAGTPVAIVFGDIGKPTLYADHADSLRFVLLLPVAVSAHGKTQQMAVECAGAIARVGNKLVYMFAYHRQSNSNSNDTTLVRTTLDEFADRAIALNKTPEK